MIIHPQPHRTNSFSILNKSTIMKHILLTLLLIVNVLLGHAQSISLISPNGGETYNGCSTAKIRWSQQTLSNTVYIDYSLDGGLNWINALTKNNGKDGNDSINWNVPNINSTKARIRVRDANTLLARDSSSANFNIIADPLNGFTINSPNGGESFSPGSVQTVSWTTKGTVGTVSLQYTINGGASWSWLYDVNNNASYYIANSGSFNWLVPANLAISSKAMIRMYDVSKDCNIDYSDAFFTIDNNPQITITAPANGASLYVGRAYNIVWTAFKLPTNSVIIDYSTDNGNTWKAIADSTYSGSTGYQYSWAIPNELTTQGILRVSATRNKAIKHQISFKIATPVVTLIHPNGGESLNGCNTTKIKWTQQGLSATVYIDYSLDEGLNWINALTRSNGKDGNDSINWNVPSMNTAKARVRIRDGNNILAKDSSKSNFTIVADPLTGFTLTSPNGGESFSPGSVQTVSWTTKGTIATVILQYSVNGGASWNWLYDASSNASYYIANTGSFNWLVPTNLAVSSKAMIRIYDVSKDCNIDYSDAFFNINNNPQITITAPANGASLYVGRAYNIVWTAFKLPTNSVIIDYSTDNGTTWKAIADSTYSGTTGYQYSWTIPNELTTQGILRVSATRNKAIQHQINFKIATPVVTLIHPNGGESLNGCNPTKIKWTQQGLSATVYIDYSLDEGLNWINALTRSNGKDGNDSINWNVPSMNIAKARVRIRDANNVLAKDSSESNFTIVADPLTGFTLTSPNGGESFSPGSVQTVSWTTKGNIPTVILQYSVNGGTSWSWLYDPSSNAAYYIANTGSFNWLVPANLTASSKVMIRVYDVSKDCNIDYSDAFFNINNNPQITITAPANGASLYVGRAYNIVWTAFKLPTNSVIIDYSTDNGTTWKAIADSTYSGSTGYQYSWTVPNEVTTQGILRVSATRNKTIQHQISFKIATPVVTLIHPNGGESLNGCNVAKIKWTQQGLSNSVYIDYSLDEGLNWIHTLTKSGGKDGNDSINWNVPNMNSAKTRIRVRDGNNALAKDSSKSNFTITVNPVTSFTILSPNGGESFSPGSVHTVSWTTKGTIPTVILQYSVNGGISWNWLYDASNNAAYYIANTGSFNWMVPTNLAVSSKAMVRIYDVNTDCNIDYSDAFFNIDNNSQITITAPANGSSLYVGRTYNISWTAFKLPSNSVSIDYSTDNGSSWKTIVDSTYSSPNGYQYSWIVPNGLTNQGILRVSATRNKTIKHQITMNILNPTLTVITPNGGENWRQGEVKNISWKTEGLETTSLLKIEYSLNKGTSWNLITSGYKNSGSYLWTIPDNLPSSSVCFVKVSSQDFLTCKDSNDVVFSIIKPVVGVLIPNSGETWYLGESRSIQWNSIGGLGNVKIEFSLDKGITWSNVIAATPNTGFYFWAIPTTISPSTNCLIKVSDELNPAVKDSSDVVFTLAKPIIDLTSPNGNEIWYAGQQHTITWINYGKKSAQVKIEFSADNGSTWSVLTSSANNNGSYAWLVPATLPASTECKIKISDGTDTSITDSSSTTFTLKKSAIYVTAPNGGEAWYIGQSKAISWTNKGAAASNVKIEYSDNAGITWHTIAAAAFNTGSYNWVIPASVAFSSTYLIRVADASDASVSDISDQFFSIRNHRIGDAFNLPIVISSFPYQTTDTLNLYSDGYTGAGNQPSNDVFYKFKVPACTDSMSFSTSGSGFDTYLHLIDSTQTVIESNNNSNSYFAEIFTRKIIPGKTYYLVVEGNNNASGIYALSIKAYHAEPEIKTSNNLTTICKGDSVTLSTRTAASYLWSNGSTQQKITVYPQDTTYYSVTVVTPRGCTFSDSIRINVIPATPPSVVQNMLPVHNALNLPLPVNFSWAPAVNAAQYDLYIWPTGTTRPLIPTLSNTSNIYYNTSSLTHGVKYNWQLVAKNSCYKTESAVQTLTIDELPDLTVTTLNVPISAPSGTLLEISWQVKNIGKGSTKSAIWDDRIILSLDTVTGNTDDVVLKDVRNLSYLQSGQSYVQKQQIKLDPKFIGQYFVYVVTASGYFLDADKKNNQAFDTLQLYASPVPDLTVTSVGAPTAAFGGSKVSITYNVKNEGNYFAEKNWTDEVFISKDSIFNQKSATSLSNTLITDNLSKDSSYLKTVVVTIPHSFEGTYYIYAFTDSKNAIFEYVHEDNNIGAAEFPIVITLRPPADLQVTTVTVPSVVSQKTMEVKWKVGNEGGNPPVENSWADKIYLSKLNIFNADSALFIGERIHNQGTDLTPGTSYATSIQATLPNGMQGDYYVYVYTDAKKEVFEYTYDDNNVKRSNQTVKIIAAPAPDLIVANVGLSADTLVAGDELVITWTVKNTGAGIAAKNWDDKIYVSNEPTFDITKAILMGAVNRLSDLDTGKTYVQNLKVNLPYSLKGAYYVYVYTDAANKVYESNNENNNITRNNTPVFIRSSASDLLVSEIKTPATAFTGQFLAISWTVKNVGKNNTSVNQWNDVVYLSTDSILDNTDVLIKREWRQTALAATAFYSPTVNYQLKGLVGNYYLIVRSDADKLVSNDSIRSNNTRSKAIAITLLPPPDLAVEKINIGTTIYAGQQLLLGFTIKNQGTGIAANNWYEGIYINSAPTLNSAVKVGTFERKTALAPGSEYTDSTLINIPAYLSGNYYLIVRTDNNDQVYEHLKEDNNIRYIPVNIITPLPSDLIVSRMSVPDSVVLGEDASMSYTIKNIGANTAIGSLKDALHLSTDNSFNGATDPLYNTQSNYIFIKPGDSLTSTVKGPLPGVLPATYYGIGRTNTLNNILEADYTNNERASDKNFSVIIPALQLEIPKDSIGLDYERNIYYKVDVAADLDLLITLTSNQMQGNNEVYVSYNKIPTAADHEYKYTNASAVNQEVLVPGTKAGTYYILLRCLSNFNNTQRVTLLARTLPFSILSINPKVVGQGVVTCTLNGAGFRDSTVVVLKNKSGVIVDTAEIRKFISSMQLKVRWHLDSVALGVYDVYAINKNGEQVSLTDGLTIEPAMKMELGVYDDNPSIVRSNRPGFFNYIFENTSNVDVQYAEISFQFPQFLDAEVNNSEFKWKHVLNTFKDYKTLVFLAKDVVVNERINVSLKLNNFKFSIFPITIFQEPYTAGQYIKSQIVAFEETRKVILKDSLNNIDPFLLEIAEDSISFRDSMIQMYVAAGIIDKNYKEYLKSRAGFEYSDKDNYVYNKKESQRDFNVPPPGCSSDPNLLCRVLYETECLNRNPRNPCYLGVFGGAVICTLTGIFLTPFAGAACALMAGGSVALCFEYNAAIELRCKLLAKNNCISVVKSCDPNDIIGPKGYEKEHWIAAKDQLPYTINFENDSTFASAPVQRVKVTQKLNDHLNPFSFRLGDFGFGSYTFKVPANTTNYHTVLDMKDSLGINVEVTAGLDIVKKEIFWTLQSIDPVTGVAPYDPFKGFLPINDYTGKGKGFVNYTIQPKANSETRDTILAEADIVFDINEPIKTPEIFNTIDAYPPKTTIDALPVVVNDTAVTLSFIGADDNGGCGIESYDLYVSENNAAFYSYKNDIHDSVYSFRGSPGTSYGFYVLAKDHVGNIEDGKTSAEAVTTFGDAKLQIHSPYEGSTFCAGDSLLITWSLFKNPGVVRSPFIYKFDFSADSAVTFKHIVTIQTDKNSYTWKIPDTLPTSKNCFIRMTLNDKYTDTSAIFTINSKPVVTFVPFTNPVCVSDPAFVLKGGSPSGGSYSGKGVASGSFTPAIAGLGKHVISYHYTDSISGCENVANQELTVDVCTNIQSFTDDAFCNIYPNPTAGNITIDYVVTDPTTLRIRLTNALGQTVYEETQHQYKGRYQKTIPLHTEKAGVYMLQIITDKKTINREIIKN
jgi:hypothetical protein